jgi:hypothetical protein
MSPPAIKPKAKTGRWLPGQSGNPAGRPKKPAWFVERIKELSPRALDELEALATDPDTPAHVRFSANKLILEYLVGPPTQSLEITAETNTRSLNVVADLPHEMRLKLHALRTEFLRLNPGRDPEPGDGSGSGD